MPNVLTIGTFDVLHEDHCWLFEFCKRIAMDDKLLVAVNTDDFVREHKGEPIQNWKTRATVVSQNQYVDDVRSFSGNTDLNDLLFFFNIRLLAVGSDWFDKNYLDRMNLTWDYLFNKQVGLLYVPSPQRVHSEEYRKKMKEL